MLASSTHQHLTGAAVRKLASESRTRLRLAEGGYRREHVRAFAQHIEVAADDALYMKGTKLPVRTPIDNKGMKSRESAFPALYRNGGWGGIRTPGTLAGTPVFKTGALNHSATHPSCGVRALAHSLASDNPQSVPPRLPVAEPDRSCQGRRARELPQPGRDHTLRASNSRR